MSPRSSGSKWERSTGIRAGSTRPAAGWAGVDAVPHCQATQAQTNHLTSEPWNDMRASVVRASTLGPAGARNRPRNRAAHYDRLDAATERKTARPPAPRDAWRSSVLPGTRLDTVHWTSEA